MKRFIALFIFFVACTGASAQQSKVTLCHFPPGNPDAAHTITVGNPSVANAHLRNHPGDHLGPCEDDTTTTTSTTTSAPTTTTTIPLTTMPTMPVPPEITIPMIPTPTTILEPAKPLGPIGPDTVLPHTA
jgi:hypothetical protein